MVAVAFKALLKFQYDDGTIFTIKGTCTDVAAAAVTFPDGSSTFNLATGKGNARLIDVTCVPAYGTDTTSMDIYVNGQIIPTDILNSANQSGTFVRQFTNAPIAFRAGSQLKFVQRA